MPDGSIERGTHRPIGFFEASAAPCPRCDRPQRLTVGEGAVVTSCMYRVKGKMCGQHMVILGLASDVSAVIPLDREEAEELRGLSFGEVIRHLGLIGATLHAA